MGSDDESRTRIRVLVVHEHPLLASVIVEILEDEPGVSVLTSAQTGADALTLTASEPVAVVVMDSRLPDMTGPALARVIKAASPETAIVFYTVDESEESLLDAVDAGATAYLTKDATGEQIVEAVRRASRGEVLIPVELFARAIARQRHVQTRQKEREKLLAEFTPRELDVLNLLSEGLDTTAMSERLGIAPHTVEWHVRHVLEKLRVHSKLQAVIEAARRGVIDLTGSRLVGIEGDSSSG